MVVWDGGKGGCIPSTCCKVAAGGSLVLQTPIRAYVYVRIEGLVASCTMSCSKIWNVVRPIRSLGLQSALCHVLNATLCEIILLLKIL